METSTPQGAARDARPVPATRLPKMLFVALLACWGIFPFMQMGVLAEDAVPFIAAARVDGPATAIYSADPNREVPPALLAAGCPITPPGTNCEAYVLPFLSPPQVLPVMEVIAATGDTLAVLIMRLVAVGGFIGGMWFLWTAVTEGRREAEVPILVAVVLLTPFVYHSAAFGQNSPLLFLSACLGLSRTERGRGAFGTAAVWVATVLFKLFPLPLLLVAVVRRRWRFVAWSTGLLIGLTVLAAVMAPEGSFSEFLQSSRVVTANRVASPWNVSLDSFIHVFDPSWRGEGRAFYAVVLVRVALIGGLAWWKLRDHDDDLLWAYAWLALLAVHPQIWWHYFMLVIPPIALVLRGRRGQIWWLVPAAAAAILPMAVVTDETTLRWLGPSLVVAAVVGVPLLASGSPRRQAAPTLA